MGLNVGELLGEEKRRGLGVLLNLVPEWEELWSEWKELGLPRKGVDVKTVLLS